MISAKIPRIMIFRLFTTCLIPRLNWAIGIVEGNEEIRELYFRIDEIIIAIIKSICIPDTSNIDELRRSYTDSTEFNVDFIDADYKFNLAFADRLCAKKENGGL